MNIPIRSEPGAARVHPDGAERALASQDRRGDALAHSEPARATLNNGEALAFVGTWPTTFTKVLPHDDHGIVESGPYAQYEAAVLAGAPEFAVTRASPSAYRSRPTKGTAPFELRGWESPIAGHQYDLEGPDAGSVGMAPAPALGSDELAAEMAEVYAMALLRDVPFETIRTGGGGAQGYVDALRAMPWYDPAGTPVDAHGIPVAEHGHSGRRRRRAGGELTSQTLFRGSSPGCETGPYVSQFLLQGNDALGGDGGEPESSRMKATYQVPSHGTHPATGEEITADKGYILYGAQRIDQRVEAQEAGTDYMRHWWEWLDVQNGANAKDEQAFAGTLRFVTTPRDLATYVHFDALYQAYLNAALLMLGWRAKGDRGLPEPNRCGTREPFATWGGPHILTLVTEPATRALKAVRRQKFQHHMRARPEALGGVATLAASEHSGRLGAAEAKARAHLDKLFGARAGGVSIMEDIHNCPSAPCFAGTPEAPSWIDGNYLLPMAFPEGSPTHPAYGAGHATVAGACVTMLKAFFEMYEADGHTPLPLARAGTAAPGVLVPEDDGSALRSVDDPGLTLQGELNKLAANISIGRNMAGVHYYSDYYDSLRMGERVAAGILLEQMATYTEPVSMTFDSFDGERITVRREDRGAIGLSVDGGAPEAWWTAHLPGRAGV